MRKWTGLSYGEPPQGIRRTLGSSVHACVLGERGQLSYGRIVGVEAQLASVGHPQISWLCQSHSVAAGCLQCKSRSWHGASFSSSGARPAVTPTSSPSPPSCLGLCRNLADNRGLCGYLPTGLAANTGATGIGIECGAAAASPSPSPSPPPPPPPPSPAAASPAVPSNTSTAGVSPAPAASPATAAPQVPAAPLTEISSAPICSCALRGFGSQDCTGALAKECRVADPPAVSNDGWHGVGGGYSVDGLLLFYVVLVQTFEHIAVISNIHAVAVRVHCVSSSKHSSLCCDWGIVLTLL